MKNASATLIDPYLYATQGLELNGVLDCAKLNRFSDLTESKDGSISYTMSFSSDEENRCCIQGNVRVAVKLECYRCLQLYPYTIDTSFQLYPVEGDITKNLSKQLDVVVMENGLVSVANIIEDELILSLPTAQLHADDDPTCKGLFSYLLRNDELRQQENPFSNFKNLFKADGTQ